MISLNHGRKIRILVVFPLSIVAGANVYADAAPNTNQAEESVDETNLYYLKQSMNKSCCF